MNIGQSETATPEKVSSKASIEIKAKSIAGDRYRNEDRAYQDSGRRVFGVFDGMGGHAGGKDASAIAANQIEANLVRFTDELSPQQTAEILKEILQQANNKILHSAEANPELEGMGTTASIVKILETASGQQKAIIAHVGDSRVYIRRSNGVLEQITLDDNLAKRHLPDKARQIQQKLSNIVDPSKLTPEEAVFYNRRNVLTQVLGRKNIEPAIEQVDVNNGDQIIITSDGIHDNLTDLEIAAILSKYRDTQEAIEQLIKAAQDRSKDPNHPRHKPDDMSAVIAKISATKKAEVAPPIPKMPVLVVGSDVSVRRSSGLIEPGWQVSGFTEIGDAIVQKVVGAQFLKKQIPQSELNELNFSKQHPPQVGFAQAQDFGQLFKLIDQTGLIAGSRETFSPNQLRHLINKVRMGWLPLEAITSTGGLRNRVAELIDAERISRKLIS